MEVLKFSIMLKEKLDGHKTKSRNMRNDGKKT